MKSRPRWFGFDAAPRYNATFARGLELHKHLQERYERLERVAYATEALHAAISHLRVVSAVTDTEFTFGVKGREYRVVVTEVE